MCRNLLLGVLILIHAASIASGNQNLFSREGYRVGNFRAPVPEDFPGGSTLDTKGVRDLIEQYSTLLIDVMPQPPQPEKRPEGSLWLPLARFNIPGSIWLPNVGFGRLSDEIDRYFRESLAHLTDGNQDQKIVFYCLADCWMSWNAAKRAVEYGYRSIYWYPQGTTGWEAAGLPLERSHPMPPVQH